MNVKGTKKGAPDESTVDTFNLDNFDIGNVGDRRRILKLWLTACSGESVTNMAKEAGVDRRQVSRWSRGEAVPDPRTAKRLRDAYLIRREGENVEKIDQIVTRDLYEIIAREQQNHRIENDVQNEIKDAPAWLVQSRVAVNEGNPESALTMLDVILQTHDYRSSESLVQTYVQHTYAVAAYHLARYRRAEIANREAETLAVRASASRRIRAAIEMLYGLIAARQDNGYRNARSHLRMASIKDPEFLTPLFNDVCITARGRFDSDFAWAAGALVMACRYHGTLDKVKFFLNDLEEDEDLTWARAHPSYRDMIRDLQEILVAMETQVHPVAIAE